MAGIAALQLLFRQQSPVDVPAYSGGMVFATMAWQIVKARSATGMTGIVRLPLMTHVVAHPLLRCILPQIQFPSRLSQSPNRRRRQVMMRRHRRRSILEADA